MGKLKFIYSAFVAAVVLLTMSTGCTKEEVVSSIKLSHSSVALSLGETVTLIATVYPEDAVDKAVTWSSSNSSVASVVGGKVAALSVGSAVITAKAGNCSAVCTVTVSAVEVSKIELSQTSLTLFEGDTVQLTATVYPENATDKTVTWSSSDTSVVTVDNGKITAISIGSATVTASSGNVTAGCSVKVNPVDVSLIELSQTSVTLLVGESVESVELTATVYPENATDQTVTWSSSDTDVVIVDEGKVTALSPGSATVTARSGNAEAECSVTVNPVEVTSIELSHTSVESVELTATVYPENATDQTVTWSSSDTDVVIVDDGKVTALSPGSATVTARSGNAEAECSVTVNPVEVTSIELSHTSVTLSTGETIELTATVYPENAADKTITWSSSNPGVATVVDGRVTALTIGSATITAQSSNGLSATCRVTVESNPDGGGSEEIGEIEW